MALLSDEYCALLLSTPLFQGLSRSDLHDIAAHLALPFRKYHARYTLARASAPCHALLIVLRGAVSQTTCAADGSYRITETLAAPLLIQVEQLFGRRLTYTSTFVTAGDGVVLTLSKRAVLALYNDYEVFRLNLLNLLVVALQKGRDHLWCAPTADLRQRIILFLLHRCSYPAGTKQIFITMATLATAVGSTRRSVAAVLTSLQDEGLLSLRRGVITIPSFEALFAAAQR